jgi:hypothetical protein
MPCRLDISGRLRRGSSGFVEEGGRDAERAIAAPTDWIWFSAIAIIFPLALAKPLNLAYSSGR